MIIYLYDKLPLEILLSYIISIVLVFYVVSKWIDKEKLRKIALGTLELILTIIWSFLIVIILGCNLNLLLKGLILLLGTITLTSIWILIEK